MGEPCDKVEEMNQPVRNRKRFLEASEDQHEAETNSRRQNLLSEWQETLKSMGVPSKKGFIGNESQYNDMIDQGLADNFEDSLSGLGVDITTASYNMSDAMLALPNVGLFKHEPNVLHHPKSSSSLPLSTSPSNFDESSQSNTTDRLFKLLSTDYPDSAPTPSIQQLLQQHIAYNNAADNNLNEDPASDVAPSEIQSEENYSMSSVVSEEIGDSIPSSNNLYENNRFQYILGAATSVAVKVNEESLTYLNQGQSYEIKVKKLGDITGCQGRLYHTKVRICFHERRLQYMEKEQMAQWKQMRPGERILEIDVPLSYGISDVIQDVKYLNVCEFNWDPTKEVGVYLKINCISTEFTPKKHGGEKGVPFRLQVETYSQPNSQSGSHDILHACACQIKVFKLKGADRKHKQDREKIMKRSPYEINKYQRQCDCTILQELSLDNLQIPSNDDNPSVSTLNGTPGKAVGPSDLSRADSTGKTSPPNIKSISSEDRESPPEEAQKFLIGTPSVPYLDIDSTASDTQSWLVSNRFANVASVFSNFTGMDILRLSRGEVIEICGLVDGIRLFNALHAKAVVPRLTLYLCLEPNVSYNAIYLKNLSLADFIKKIAELMKVSSECVHDVYIQGPSNINVHVTDEVVRNFKDESTFTVEILQDSSGEKFRILLRNSATTSAEATINSTCNH
ncbi:UNVERIFIED_CONTAM: hypothetical protein RMT77_014152 [Armadillidium vulgare]